MAFDKTKLWSPAARRCEGGDALLQTTRRAEAITRFFQTADLIHGGQSTRARVGSATRIMPIEELLRGELEAHDGTQQLERKLRGTPEPRERLRRAAALLALVGSALLAWWSPFDFTAQALLETAAATAEEPPVEARVPEVVAEPSKAEPALGSAALEPRASRKSRRHAERAPELAAHLPRSAVDAVAAGDYAGAARSYDLLAARQPDQPAYAEAARILRQRMAARGR